MIRRFNGIGAALRKAFGPPSTKDGEDAHIPDTLEAVQSLSTAADHLSAVSRMITSQNPSEVAGGPPKRDTLEEAVRRLARLCRD